MSEHNKNFYSLEEVERCLEASKEFQDGEEIYYFIGALRYVYNENKQLKFQLQQKENIIKELNDKIEDDKMIIEGNWGCIDNLRKDYNLQKNIIQEAIEYLKENACIDEDVEYFCDDLRYDECKKLLDILKGEK